MRGLKMTITECEDEQGVYWRVHSEGPIEFTAPRMIITGDLHVSGNITSGGDMTADGKVTDSDGDGGA